MINFINLKRDDLYMTYTSLLNNLNDIEDDRINFEDKISLLFMIIGAIFLVIIVVSLAMNFLQFQQVEFQSPFL